MPGNVVEGAHHRRGTGLHPHFERRKRRIPQRLRGDLGVVVIAAAVGIGVAHEMFQTGGDRTVRRQVVALIALHRGGTHHSVQVGVLAVTFGHAAPAGVARHIDHRREGPVHARQPRLTRRDAARLPDQRLVPRAGLPQRNGEDRAIAVDHVEAAQDRNPEPRLLDGLALNPVVIRRTGTAVEQRADHRAHGLRLALDVVDVHVLSIGPLSDLHHLLFERHASQQVLHAVFDSRRGVLVDLPVGTSRQTRRRHEQPQGDCFSVHRN